MISFSKIIIYYVILYFSVKIIKEKILKKKNIKLKDFFCNKSIIKEDTKNNINDNKYALIPYKHKKVSKITLQEVYDNFYNNKKTKLENDIDLNLYNLVNINKEVIKKEKLILNDSKENLILEDPDNFLIYNFNSNETSSYKIKCKLFIKNCKNIKLIISECKKRFIYDYNKENINNEEIKEFGFILNNNFNINDNITIYFLFDKNDISNKLVIESLFIEIIEKNLEKEDSLIIFDINNKYLPFYTDVDNILDFSEYVDKSNVFFF